MANGIQATERVLMQKVDPSEGYWQFVIPSEKQDLRLSTQLNVPATQEDHAKYVSPLGLSAANLRDTMRVFSALYELRGKGGEVETARQFIQNAMRTRYPSTSTRIVYMPSGQKDIIIHDFGRASMQETPKDFTDADMPLSQMPLEVCLALTGKTPQETSEIISYLNGNTPSYVWRINRKPTQRDERVVWFFAYSDWSYLYCIRGPADQFPAFRVSVASTEGASHSALANLSNENQRANGEQSVAKSAGESA